MSAPKFSNPFAPLNLAAEAEAQLSELAQVFVEEAMANYQQYLAKDQRQLDPARWKFLKQREDVSVYCERSQRSQRRHSMQRMQPQGSIRDSLSSMSDNETDFEQQSSQPSNPSELPVMLTVGTLVGSFYDTMYGVVNPSLDMLRIKTSYVNDNVVNAAILAKIEEPSLEDPFRSLTVRWAIKGQPLHIRTLIKNRDMVYLEATGLARLPSTGEQVGYQLLHSVNFPQTHPLPYAQRGNISICALYKQHSENTVDIYARGFLDPTGRIMRALVIKSATDVMISVGRNIVCSQLKKLAYALRRRHSRGLLMHATQLDEQMQLRDANKHNHRARGQASSAKACTICYKGLSSMASLSFGKKSHGVQCRLCLQIVCSACRVKKTLSGVNPQDSYLYQQTVTFCTMCVAAVTKANAFEIACDEVAQKDAPLGYGRSVTSSVSSTTMSDSFDEYTNTNSSVSSSHSHTHSQHHSQRQQHPVGNSRSVRSYSSDGEARHQQGMRC